MDDPDPFELAVQRRLADIMRQPWLVDMKKPKERELIANRLERGEALTAHQNQWLIKTLRDRKFPKEPDNDFGMQVLYVQLLNACTGERMPRHYGDDKDGDHMLCATEVVSEALYRVGIDVKADALEKGYKRNRKRHPFS